VLSFDESIDRVGTVERPELWSGLAARGAVRLCRRFVLGATNERGDYSDTVRPASNPSEATISSITSCGTAVSVVIAIAARRP
jgi:hypothetical protein